MSCYEWERGEITIPASEWVGLKALVMSSWNDHRERVFRLAFGMYAKMTGPLNCTWGELTRSWGDVGRASDEEIAAIERLLFPLGHRADAGKPKKPTRKQLNAVLPKATRRTFAYRISRNALILFRGVGRTVVWQVEKGNHARSRARSHRVAGDFFRALEKVCWKRGSGGAIYGNNGYHRDAERERPGAGGSYVIATYGASHWWRLGLAA